MADSFHLRWQVDEISCIEHACSCFRQKRPNGESTWVRWYGLSSKTRPTTWSLLDNAFVFPNDSPVMDCHQDWCGRCETLQPTFQRISVETDHSEDRCLFLEANLDKFAERIQAHLPKDSQVDLTTHGCIPFTVLIKGGAAVATIRGCDAPAILREVTKHMPPLRTGEDKEVEPE